MLSLKNSKEQRMSTPDFSALVSQHRNYFRSGATRSVEWREQYLGATPSGDAAVNDCTIQPLISDLPFGGVGNSGMGKYHGEWGFRTYTNVRGVLYHDTRIDPDPRYPPYSSRKPARELVTS